MKMPFNIEVTSQWPGRRVYVDRQQNGKPRPSDSNRHRGQEKLRLGENFFFAACLSDGLVQRDEVVNVIYVGAAPCHKFTEMVERLPKWQFHMYDTARFDADLGSYDNVHLHDEFFTDATAAQYKPHNRTTKILFISDIRTREHSAEGHNQESIEEDLDNQRGWVERIQPDASWLKFRFPFERSLKEGEKYEYLRGRIILQPWAPKNSTETRLYVKKSDILRPRRYNMLDYEQRLCHFNNVERVDNDYDAILEHFYKELWESFSTDMIGSMGQSDKNESSDGNESSDSYEWGSNGYGQTRITRSQQQRCQRKNQRNQQVNANRRSSDRFRPESPPIFETEANPYIINHFPVNTLDATMSMLSRKDVQ